MPKNNDKCYYELIFKDQDGTLSHRPVVTELPATAESLIKMIAIEDSSVNEKELKEQFASCDRKEFEEADDLFDVRLNTQRIMTGFGDFFVKPSGRYSISFLIKTKGSNDTIFKIKAHRANLGRNMMERLMIIIRDAAAGIIGKDPVDVTWSDVFRIQPEQFERFGITYQPIWKMASVECALGDRICGPKTYEATIEMTAAQMKIIRKYLTTKGYQGEDDTLSFTSQFPDGMQMDVKCCGSQDETSWTEAVLFFPSGGEACCTDTGDDLLGDWELEYSGNTYVTHVIEKG